jgi:hypothetical protein
MGRVDGWDPKARKPYRERFGVDEDAADDFDFLYGRIVGFWRENYASFPHPQVEWPFDVFIITGGFRITGHIDLFDMYETAETIHINIVDYKSTRLFERADYRHQMMLYALGALVHFGLLNGLKNVLIHDRIVWLRDSSTESINKERPLTRADVMDWLNEFIENVVKWDGRTYTPGEQCKYCPRYVGCSAHSEMVRKSIRDISLVDLEDSALVPPEMLVELYSQVGVVEKQCEIARAAIKARALAAGRRLRGVKGFDYLVRDETRESIDPLKAWPTITAYLPDEDDLAKVVKIGKTALLKTIADKVEKDKGKIKARVMDDLRAAGAVTTETYPKGHIVKSEGQG